MSNKIKYTIGLSLTLLILLPHQVHGDKSVNDLPNPNRNYYDECGNEFDYEGNLLKHGNACIVQQEEPITVPEGFQGK